MSTTKTFVDFSQAFATTSKPIAEFYSEAGLGFYIPLYQREYSWDTENIEQLMEDLCQGTEMLLEKEDAILFMGTIILLTEANPTQNINPQDIRALPTRIDNVIDGQQRISTFALLATLLYERLRASSISLKKDAAKLTLDNALSQELDHVYQEIDSQLGNLRDIFSLDLKRGNPKRKPIIIRGSEDYWHLDGADDDSYRSEVAKHLAYTIRTIEQQTQFKIAGENSQVKRNLKRMNERLKDIEQAHIVQQDDFPEAAKILERLPQQAVWSYEKPEITRIFTDSTSSFQALKHRVSVVVQLLTFVNFMLKRCCFTVIKPVTQNWAFDMFQSLNATGTPLTSLETFKPTVSNHAELKGGYRNSHSEAYFKVIDEFFNLANSANVKNRYTNDFLTTFALLQDGTKLPNQFSHQRQFLEKQYENCASEQDKEEFVRRMADLSRFRMNVTHLEIDVQARISLTAGADDAERELAVLCVAYLKKCNHKMADPVLSRYYTALIRADEVTRPQARNNFLAVCKALAAFYTLWRSASSNSGLDDFYRKLMRDEVSWLQSTNPPALANIKTFLRDALQIKGIGDKASWKQKAIQELRYDNGVDPVCRFALLVTAHDTIPDPNQTGSMITGQSGVSPYFRLEKWLSKDLASIEHIAPQNPTARSSWDSSLYETDVYQQIGNLTLLPIEINISAGNRGWKEKCLYYQYLVVQNPVIDRDNIKHEAAQHGISLKLETLQRLEQSKHHAHLKPIVSIGLSGLWDQDLVDKRSDRICSLLWDFLIRWLE